MAHKDRKKKIRYKGKLKDLPHYKDKDKKKFTPPKFDADIDIKKSKVDYETGKETPIYTEKFRKGKSQGRKSAGEAFIEKYGQPERRGDAPPMTTPPMGAEIPPPEDKVLLGIPRGVSEEGFLTTKEGQEIRGTRGLADLGKSVGESALLGGAGRAFKAMRGAKAAAPKVVSSMDDFASWGGKMQSRAQAELAKQQTINRISDAYKGISTRQASKIYAEAARVKPQGLRALIPKTKMGKIIAGGAISGTMGYQTMVFWGAADNLGTQAVMRANGLKDTAKWGDLDPEFYEETKAEIRNIYHIGKSSMFIASFLNPPLAYFNYKFFGSILEENMNGIEQTFSEIDDILDNKRKEEAQQEATGRDPDFRPWWDNTNPNVRTTTQP